MQKKCNRFKKIKNYLKDKRKEEEERKRGNKENFTELQKPNVEAEVYDNNKKCD